MSLVSEVRELLDESGGAVFWVSEQIYDALNEAILDAYASTRQEFGTATITFTASNADVNLPLSIWIPQTIVGTKGRYFPTTQAKLEQFSRRWKDTKPGYPKHFVLNDYYSIMAYPTPDAAYEFVVSGVPWPMCGEVVDGNENPTLPRQIKDIIIRRTCSALLEYTQPTLSEQYFKEALEMEHDYRVQLRNRQSHKIRRLQPGTLFTRAQSGEVETGRRYY
jgi:hypothetical protein